MSEAIYQQALKDLAQAAHGARQLANHDGEAKRDTPLCGDRVKIEVARDGGRITALAQQTRGCLLCRASASALALRAPGLAPEEIESATRALRGMLTAGGAPPAAWPELAVFLPVRGHPSRHGCVLLPFDTLLEALAGPLIPPAGVGQTP